MRLTILIILSLLFANNLSAEELRQLEVSFYNTIYIYLPDKIVDIDIGYDNDFEIMYKENEVKITTLTDSLNYKTNLTIKTKNSLFAFNLIYKEKPNKIYNFISNDMAIHSFNEKEKNSTASYKKTGTQEQKNNTEKKDSICEKISNIKNLEIINGIVDEKIFFGLGEIFVHGDQLYFPLIIRNNSNLNYDINFIKFKTEGKRTTRKSALQENYKEPSYIYNKCERISSGDWTCQIFVFDKFTLPDKKYFHFELSENKGTRHLRFHISKKNILKSKKI